MRVIAVDWSGAVVGSEKKIWLAEAGWGAGGGGAARDDAAVGGRIVRLECGRTRDEVAEHLIELAGEDARLVVGLDFAFSMPAWFMRQRGFATAPMLWQRLAAGAAERWLASCEPPFWGRAGRRKPAAEGPGLRLTDVAAKAKSVFQVGGAGSVGTGSLRGMCVLHRLREAGFYVWPFDAPGWPLAVEIYPRTWTRGVVVRSAAAREAHAAARWPGLPAAMRQAVVASEDAFDAVAAAVGMDACRGELASLPVVGHPVVRLEGAIWVPGEGGGLEE